jgi:hypothetical protein
MKKWEYFQILAKDVNDLNVWGQQGWELIFINDRSMAFFKREIVNTEKKNGR